MNAINKRKLLKKRTKTQSNRMKVQTENKPSLPLHIRTTEALHIDLTEEREQIETYLMQPLNIGLGSKMENKKVLQENTKVNWRHGGGTVKMLAGGTYSSWERSGERRYGVGHGEIVFREQIEWSKVAEKVRQDCERIILGKCQLLEETKRLILQLQNKGSGTKGKSEQPVDEQWFNGPSPDSDDVEIVYQIFDRSSLLRSPSSFQSKSHLLHRRDQSRNLKYRPTAIPNKYISKAIDFGSKGFFSNHLNINEHLQLDFGQQTPDFTFAMAEKHDRISVLRKYPHLIGSESNDIPLFLQYPTMRRKIGGFYKKRGLDSGKLGLFEQYEDDVLCLSSNLEFGMLSLQTFQFPKQEQQNGAGKSEMTDEVFDLEWENVDHVLQIRSKQSLPNPQKPDIQLDQNLIEKFEPFPYPVLEPFHLYKMNFHNRTKTSPLLDPITVHYSVSQTKQLFLQACTKSVNKLSDILFKINQLLPDKKINHKEALYYFSVMAVEGLCRVHIEGEEAYISEKIV